MNESTLSGIALFLILFSVVIIILGIVKIHEWPGKVAAARQHPQVDAINAMSVMGLLIFPFWMAALIWAYTRPIFKPIEQEQSGDNP